MLIGQRLRELRESNKLSQGDLEKRTGLLRSYTSRVENGHTVPSIETLEKYARALEVPLYRLFYEGNKPPKQPAVTFPKAVERGASGKQSGQLKILAKFLSRMDERQQRLLLLVAQRMAYRGRIK